MFTLILSYLGGVLTILSPCVLPVVPLIFARSDRPFRTSGLPMLIGMGLSFASFAALSVVGGSWVIHANQIGRMVALVVFAILGLSLIFPQVADELMRPFVRLGGFLQKRADTHHGLGSALLLGASVGLLWAPCAGPILGLVLAGAAWGGSTQKTFGLLLVFALGAATSLGLAIFAGGKVLSVMKKGFGAQEWIRRALGIAVLCAVGAIALGLDTKLLVNLASFNTSKLEQTLIDQAALGQPTSTKSSALADEGPVPPLAGATQWLNSAPLSIESLRGKVVLVDFWTYSCINCLRTLPYVKAWDAKYRSQGLVVIGVHTPEFAFEKSIDNVSGAVANLNITYPVAVDSNQVIWSAFHNQYWPAHYFIDTEGRIRFHHFGEGNYAESEKVIQELLAEAHGNQVSPSLPAVPPATPTQGAGVEAPPSQDQSVSPETYVGYARQEGFVSAPDIQRDHEATYTLPARLALNQWGLAGTWHIGPEVATLRTPNGKLTFRFRARDLHLVLGAPDGRTIPFRVTIDGKFPTTSHGQDIDASGYGEVKAYRLYQLVRQTLDPADAGTEHTFEIEFMAPDAEVFAFTFG